MDEIHEDHHLLFFFSETNNEGNVEGFKRTEAQIGEDTDWVKMLFEIPDFLEKGYTAPTDHFAKVAAGSNIIPTSM